MNELIKSKRKMFKLSSKKDQNFKKIIKIKTEEKENYANPSKSDRNKILSSNVQSLR